MPKRSRVHCFGGLCKHPHYALGNKRRRFLVHAGVTRLTEAEHTLSDRCSPQVASAEHAKTSDTLQTPSECRFSLFLQEKQLRYTHSDPLEYVLSLSIS